MKLLVKKIGPKRAEVINVATLRSELNEAMEELQDGVLRDFESTVATWSTQVGFDVKLTTGQAITLKVSPSGSGAEIWGHVNEGTRPHIIRPRNARALAFRSNYRAKTAPGRIRSGAGGSRGASVFSQQVFHPGSEGRDFTGLIADKWKPEFKRIGENAMRRVARK
jgi:hypothetical protein